MVETSVKYSNLIVDGSCQLRQSLNGKILVVRHFNHLGLAGSLVHSLFQVGQLRVERLGDLLHVLGHGFQLALVNLEDFSNNCRGSGKGCSIARS